MWTKIEKEWDSCSYSGQIFPLKLAEGNRRYGSLVNINPSALEKIMSRIMLTKSLLLPRTEDLSISYSISLFSTQLIIQKSTEAAAATLPIIFRWLKMLILVALL